MATGSVIESSLPPTKSGQNLDPVEVETLDPGDEGGEVVTEEEPFEEDEFFEEPVPAPARQLTGFEALQTDEERAAWRDGWRPREMWRGRTEDWKTAAEYNRRGREIVPILQRRLDESEARNSQFETEMQRLTDLLDKQAGTIERQGHLLEETRGRIAQADQAGYDRALAEAKASRREGYANQDLGQVAQAQDRIDALEEERAQQRAAQPAPKPVPKQETPVNPQPQPQVRLDPAVQKFIDANPWYYTDQTLNAAMIAEHKAILEESPGMALGDNLQAAKERVMARHPAKFGIDPNTSSAERQQRPGPAAPTGRRQSQQRQGASPFDTITDPAERAGAIRSYELMKRTMPDLTTREYLAIYNDPHRDVLEVLAEVRARQRQPAAGRRVIRG